MALSSCPEDVLFNIASYLHSNSPPNVYCTDLRDRVRIFGRLVLVCRHFYKVFTRLLYRTLCYTYENNTWPEAYGGLWFRQNPQRRVMSALRQTLSAAPALGSYTHFLEVRWEDHGVEYENLNRFLRIFPNLRELDIVVPYQNRHPWIPDFVYCNSMEYLQTLRINLPIPSKKLPDIFFLPNLEHLEVVDFNPGETYQWPLGPGAEPGRSKITHLSLTASLTPLHLLQILSWPVSLAAFKFVFRPHSFCLGTDATTASFSAALQRFRQTLTTITLQIPHDYFSDEQDVHGTGQYLYLQTSQFTVLEEIHAPCFLFTGPPGPHYNRENIHTYLPSSLGTLEVNFTSNDLFLFSSWHRGNQLGHTHIEKYQWLITLGREIAPLGRLPRLERVSIRDEGLWTMYWPLPGILRTTFCSQYERCSRIKLDVNLVVPGCTEWEHGDYDEHFLYNWSENHFYGVDADPLFGDEQTAYSDSPRGWDYDDEDEDAAEKELMEDEDWEQLDSRMTAECEVEGREWVRGSWPPYEETREQRELIPRNSLIGALFELPTDME